MVWLTPQMDRLFLEGPGGRRRFLDRLVLALDPAHAARVGAYEQALRERARLLRTSVPSTGRPIRPGSRALEEVMARKGSRSRRRGAMSCPARCRLRLGRRPVSARQLALPAWSRPGWTSSGARRRGIICRRAGLCPARRRLAGGAAVGPHRSDLAVLIAYGGAAAEYASTGEQKALLISILLAHARIAAASRGERRCCCSTRSPPISMRTGAPRSSRR